MPLLGMGIGSVLSRQAELNPLQIVLAGQPNLRFCSPVRIIFHLFTVCAAVAACTSPREVSSPSTVSYKVKGNDVSRSNLEADIYCARYGLSALFQGLQTSPSGNLAIYSCADAAATIKAPAPLEAPRRAI